MNDNGNKYALAALKDRRASVAGEITVTQKRLQYLIDCLAHIDGTLALLAPGLNPSRIPAKKAYRRVKLFGQGELNRLILDAMRGQKPLSTHEIVAAIVKRKAYDENAAKGMTHRVRANLQYLFAERGIIEKAGTGRTTTWAIRV